MIPYRHTVQYYETHKMGITHHSNYIRFMEEARIDFLRRIGWPFEQLEQQGVISPVVSISCNYRKTTAFADEIEIAVRVEEVTKVRFLMSYVMTVSGIVVCTAQSSHCFVSADGRPVSIEKQCPGFYAALRELCGQ